MEYFFVTYCFTEIIIHHIQINLVRVDYWSGLVLKLGVTKRKEKELADELFFICGCVLPPSGH